MKQSAPFNYILIITLAIILAITAASAYTPQCSDGIDNDLDGKIDYPADDGCLSLSDNDENKLIRYADGCLTQGDKLKNIFGETTFFCMHDLCHICVGLYEIGNYTAASYRCYGLPACEFGSGNGNTTIDTKPPEITVNSPANQGLYSSKNVPINISTDELAEISYYNVGSSRWTTLCTNCRKYSGKKSFQEGANEMLIKAEDIAGNEATLMLNFLVDSKKPRILKTFPKNKGFTNGLFIAIIDELNLVELKLTYGNNGTGFRSENVDCQGGKKVSCEKNINLQDYDGQEIEYYFELTDIVGNYVKSKTTRARADSLAPKFNSINYNVNGRYVIFNISIEELNFESLEFYDSFDLHPKWKTLCSRLKNGYCIAKKSFSTGQHDISLQLTDKAGNAVSESLSFVI